jgi:hypothetical protein
VKEEDYFLEKKEILLNGKRVKFRKPQSRGIKKDLHCCWLKAKSLVINDESLKEKHVKI